MIKQVYNISSKRLNIGITGHCGGAVTSFRFLDNNGQWQDILRPVGKEFFKAPDPLETGCFPLFPFSNRIADGHFSYNGQDYNLPANMEGEPHAIHGIQWQKKALVTEYSESYVKIISNHNTADYPFIFSTVQEWKVLNETDIEISLGILNIGDKTMPFGMGIHPYFTRTPECTIKANTKAVILNDDNMIPVSITQIPQEWDFSKKLRVNSTTMDNCFTGWDGICSMEWPELNTKLTIKADNLFANMVVYIPDNEDFFCLEPVSNINDAFNNSLELPETGVIELHPGEKVKSTIEMSFSSI